MVTTMEPHGGTACYGFTRSHSDYDRILVADELDHEMIAGLATGRLLAVVLPDFYDAAASARIATPVMKAPGWGTYEADSAKGIATRGNALFDCHGREECDSYFEDADRYRVDARALVSPYSNPADRMQVVLDHAWNGGATLMRIGGERCNFGLVRAFQDGGAALPHVDACNWDWPSDETAACNAQLAVNTYLSISDLGGELELWDISPDQCQYEQMRLEGTYGLDRELLPAPEAVLCPTPGSFVMFNASKVHAVQASYGGVRLTVSGFAIFSCASEALRLLS